MSLSLSLSFYNQYLLVAEFSVRTVNYGPSFFPSICGAKHIIYSTNRKNEANKMFIMWLLPVWHRKQVQDARFDNHLTGAKKESFYWLTKTIAHKKRGSEKVKTNIRHVEKVYLVKTKSAVSLSSSM